MMKYFFIIFLQFCIGFTLRYLCPSLDVVSILKIVFGLSIATVFAITGLRWMRIEQRSHRTMEYYNPDADGEALFNIGITQAIESNVNQSRDQAIIYWLYKFLASNTWVCQLTSWTILSIGIIVDLLDNDTQSAFARSGCVLVIFAVLLLIAHRWLSEDMRRIEEKYPEILARSENSLMFKEVADRYKVILDKKGLLQTSILTLSRFEAWGLIFGTLVWGFGDLYFV